MKKSKSTRETKAALIIERDALKIQLAKSRHMAAKLASAVLEGERLEAKIAAERAQTMDAIERRRRREARIHAEEMAAVTQAAGPRMDHRKVGRIRRGPRDLLERNRSSCG
ncbi:hypothetical protein GOD58_16655 [Sinorhizobium medicae]|nr:hypothetical protein [Sinorhizobium medicae]